jgi:hypothetical protein
MIADTEYRKPQIAADAGGGSLAWLFLQDS